MDNFTQERIKENERIRLAVELEKEKEEKKESISDNTEKKEQ